MDFINFLKENIYVLEKAREIGQHCLSGALLDPRSMRELLPGFENEAPIEALVSKEAVYFFTKGGQFKLPITPPPSALALATAVRAAGGRALIVGGWVRDALLGLDSKDLDIEVFGLSADRLKALLDARGRVE